MSFWERCQQFFGKKAPRKDISLKERCGEILCKYEATPEEEELVLRYDRVLTNLEDLKTVCSEDKYDFFSCDYVLELQKRVELSYKRDDLKFWELVIARHHIDLLPEIREKRGKR